MIKLREWHFPSPYSRNTMGEKEALEKLTLALCKVDFVDRYQARGSILALAGNIDFDEIRSEVEKHLGSWQARPPVSAWPSRAFSARRVLRGRTSSR